MLLITGSSGFIGFHLAKKRLAMGDVVVGVDNHNDYYDVGLKEARLARLKAHDNFIFEKIDIADTAAVQQLFKTYRFKKVVNLAAQAGVRYSIANPLAYIHANVLGFTNIIEACSHHAVEHVVYASTSSVYGANTSQPFTESQTVDHPLAVYPATKKCNELIAHAYANIYQLPATGLRFFTVYGPWGRPDMALFKFVKAILKDEPIKVFNHGKMKRDFTYVDDVVTAMAKIIDHPATPDPDWRGDQPNPATSYAPYRIYNIGNCQPVDLLIYINMIEELLGKKANKIMMPLQDGDVLTTFADTTALQQQFNYRPQTPIATGIKKFIDWYRDFYTI
ncbi:MAG: NAD-dependent epimerase/dehydratase family protein [Pseudomonadota bacterium]